MLVYANSLSAPFIFDDQISIVENQAIRSVASARSQPENTPLAGRPVAGLTFALNYAASELDAPAYRATNLVIHAACALLLFGLIRRTLALPRLSATFGRHSSDLALAVALLWTVHPLTTDAVTYITQRTESLMALFYLLTLYASLRAHVSSHPAGWQAAAVGACALGMGCKESMVTAPLVVVLFDRVFLFETLRDAFRSRWRLYLGLALTWVFLALQLAAAPRSNSAGFETGVGVWTYLLNQSVMITRYLRLVFWPVDLVINYGPPVAYGLGDVLPHAAAIASLAIVGVAAFRWSPPAAFLAAWFFITLAPSSSFIPIATEVGAERRMYLPLMSVLTGIVVALYRWTSVRQYGSRRLALTSMTVAAVLLGAGTIRRNAEHQSWLTLAETTLERWPTDVAYASVGSELVRRQRDDEALPLLRIAARTDPRGRYNLGVALFNLKRYTEAIRELDVLVGEHPMREEVPWAHRTMGSAYLRLSSWPEAISQLRMTLVMTPHDAEARQMLVTAYNSYGVTLAQDRRFTEAIDQFRHALDLHEQNASARYYLAAALYDTEQFRESFAEAQRALALRPTDPDALHLMGKLLAQQGRLQEGLAHLETAVKFRPEDEVLQQDLARLQQVIRSQPK